MELRAEGATLSEAFSRIALALFAAAVDPATVEEIEPREVRAHGAGLPALLRRWLEECLYVHEVEGFACRSIEFAVFAAAAGAGGEPVRLHAFLRGEPLDPGRHRIQTSIRGIAAGGLQVREGPGGWSLQATLDL